MVVADCAYGYIAAFGVRVVGGGWSAHNCGGFFGLSLRYVSVDFINKIWWMQILHLLFVRSRLPFHRVLCCHSDAKYVASISVLPQLQPSWILQRIGFDNVQSRISLPQYDEMYTHSHCIRSTNCPLMIYSYIYFYNIDLITTVWDLRFRFWMEFVIRRVELIEITEAMLWCATWSC